MGRPKTVKRCKTHDEFVSCVQRQGGEMSNGRRHTKLWMPGEPGKVMVPRHRGDLATGTRHSIQRGLLALGFLLIIGACSAVALAQGLP